jgi:hypothetical protein
MAAVETSRPLRTSPMDGTVLSTRATPRLSASGVAVEQGIDDTLCKPLG